MEFICQKIRKTWDVKAHVKWTEEEYKWFLKVSTQEFPQEYRYEEQLLQNMISEYVFNACIVNGKISKKASEAFKDLQKWNDLVIYPLKKV